MAFYHKLPPKEGGYSQEAVKVIKTRKEHPCLICKNVIPKGNKTVRDIIIDSDVDEFYVVYICEKCVNTLSNIENKNAHAQNVVDVWNQYKS